MDYKNSELSDAQNIGFYAASAVFGAVMGWLFYDSLIAGLIPGIMLSSTKTYYKRFLVNRRRSKLLMQFRDLLYSVSSFAAAGRSLGDSLESSIEFWKGTYDENDMIIIELKSMTKRMKEGRERDVDVLRNFADRSGIEDISDLVTVCETCKKTGGDFAKAINKSARIIGDKIALERELAVLISQKRFEGRIVSASPFAIIFFIKCLSPSYLIPLTSTFQGRMIATLALAMIAAGWVLTERMNNFEL